MAWAVRGLFMFLLGAMPIFYFVAQRSNAVAFAPSFDGFHETATCSTISGWAWDAMQPNTPISVDIFSDEVFLATVLADQFRQDLLNTGKGNGNHGFTFTVPAELLDGQPHSIRVRFANTGISLFNTPRTINCTMNAYEGIHEAANCNTISGWAWDGNQPNTPISVDVYFDNDNVASIRAPANQFRQDLLNAGIGNGSHGFSFPTPMSLKNGQPHTVRIKFAFTAIDLQNTSKSITCNPPAGPFYEGFQETTDCNVISGWAWDAMQPNTPIHVDIYASAQLLASPPANIFRQDLLNAGKGNGSHGFVFTVPSSLRDGQTHSINVGFGGTAIGLFNTPKSINCPPDSGPVYEGFHEVANCTTISGWAWDATQPNTPISVDIFADNMLLMTVTANQPRQDLVDVGKGNGVHGFTFAVPPSLIDGQPHSILIKFASTNTNLGATPKSITCAP